MSVNEEGSPSFYQTNGTMEEDVVVVVDDGASCSSSTSMIHSHQQQNQQHQHQQVDINDISNIIDPATLSQSLFHAVASRDYTSLVTLYGNHARISIVQFLQMKRRWICKDDTNHNNDDSHEYGAEEKMDEFLQQLAYSQQQQRMHPYHGGSRYSYRGDNRGTTPTNGDDDYIRLLHELTSFLVEEHKSSVATSGKPPATSKASSNEKSKSNLSSGHGKSTIQRPVVKKSKSSVRDASISTSMYDAERLLRDTASILSDTRPPSNFVVYSSSSISNKATMNNVPPLFDGSVANATPPPLGGAGAAATMALAAAAAGGIGGATGSAAAAGGGCGTILHLACALDAPLCLAFVLSMGADARACHTAFRRLLIHEAACNGSIHCLQLLLEVGQYYDSLYSKQQQQYEGLKSPDTSMDFPFVQSTPPRTGKDRSMSPTLRYRRSNTSPAELLSRNSASASSKPSANRRQLGSPRSSAYEEFDFGDKCSDAYMNGPQEIYDDELYSQDDDDFYHNNSQPLDFVSSLILFRDLSRQVKAGTITELDAARKVMLHATLPESSKLALAKSCTYYPRDTSSFRSERSHLHEAGGPYHPLGNNALWRLPQAIAGRSDGHGNSPLHWAAFKNETECVKLLLQYNADPNARAHPSGWTPLHDAAYSNGYESIRLLLDNGAHVDSRANSGATPLCFAAQEDAAEAAALLLERGADLTIRCSAAYNNNNTNNGGDQQNAPAGNMSRFSGYTPLHYCAHYNAKNAARMLLQHPTAKTAMEITDFNDRLPIHVAVARGSSDVLRELLRAGARVETRASPASNGSSNESTLNTSSNSNSSGTRESRSSRRNRRSARRTDEETTTARVVTPTSSLTTASATSLTTGDPAPTAPVPVSESPATPRRRRTRNRSRSSDSLQSRPQTPSTPPVSSPMLRSMIPSQPVVSSKPWNCLSQRSIDECRKLISEVEQNWTPDRHSIFTPTDRKAVAALLLVGKRYELQKNIFVDVWPEILSFCGRGWFEKNKIEAEDESMEDESESSSSDFVEDNNQQPRFGLNRNSNTRGNDTDDLSLPTFC